MSSHHIVREKQEPALLIMSLAGFNLENLGQLLEWSPTVIVNDTAYEETDSLGIKIDGVVSHSSTRQPALQPGTFVIRTEDTALEDALKYLAGEQYHSVNIIATSFCIKDYALFAEHLTMTILTPAKKIFPVKSGFSKWKPKGEKVEILSEVRHLQTQGLKKTEEHVYLTEKEGFYSLSFDVPFIFVAEDL
ncbi:thiamine pyrophosphokinase [Arcticibacter sp. MXS-1]|uniref:thiamine pyrophosphokinase n=1 Tax=Arcticibacter sp. MXS-1 TaxID=3341726 RepID=UPI0035A8F808